MLLGDTTESFLDDLPKEFFKLAVSDKMAIHEWCSKKFELVYHFKPIQRNWTYRGRNLVNESMENENGAKTTYLLLFVQPEEAHFILPKSQYEFTENCSCKQTLIEAMDK